MIGCGGGISLGGYMGRLLADTEIVRGCWNIDRLSLVGTRLR